MKNKEGVLRHNHTVKSRILKLKIQGRTCIQNNVKVQAKYTGLFKPLWNN